jgi:glycine cleavage system regulatory protein
LATHAVGELVELTAAVVEAVGNVLVSPLAQFELYVEASRRPALAAQAPARLHANLGARRAVLEELGASDPKT